MKHAATLVLRYAADRLSGYPRGTRLTMGNALCASLLCSVIDAGATVRLRCEVRRIDKGTGTSHVPVWRHPMGRTRCAASGRRLCRRRVLGEPALA